MKQFIIDITNMIGQLSIIDMITLIALITFIILIISVIYFYRLSSLEIEESEVNDMIDLKEITKKIEEAPKGINIELTEYEKEQEQNAIISYDELIRSNNAMHINYKTEEDVSGVSVKEIDLKNIATVDKHSTDTKVCVINYEAEEAFLEALKNLKNMLS